MPAKRSSTSKRRGDNGPRRGGSRSGERTVKRLRLSKALTIPDSTTVADACRRMAARRVDAALLTDSNALLCGIVTDKDIAVRVIAEGLNPDEVPVSKVMTRNPIFCMTDTLAVEALQRMGQGKFRHLPVVENGPGGMEVVALLDITKCLYDAIARMERAAEKGNAIAAAVDEVERQWGSSTVSAPVSFIETLKERMFRPTLGTLVGDSTRVPTIHPTDTVMTAAKKMKEFRVSSVVIVQPGGNKPVGIITTKDILMRVVALGYPTDSTPVEKVMTPNPECAALDTTIVDALHTMHDGKFLHLPIVDRDGNLVACVDVLQLTHGAVATVGRMEGTDGGSSNMLQKFWDSALNLPERDDDTDSFHGSDISRGITTNSEYISAGAASVVAAGAAPNSFAYKIEDASGRIHRFNAGTESLTELQVAVASRMGEDLSPSDLPSLVYEDEDGDQVLLASDGDLVAAITTARAHHWKVLKLHFEADGVQQQQRRRQQQQHRRTQSSLSQPRSPWSPNAASGALAKGGGGGRGGGGGGSFLEDEPYFSASSVAAMGVVAAAVVVGVAIYMRSSAS